MLFTADNSSITVNLTIKRKRKRAAALAGNVAHCHSGRGQKVNNFRKKELMLLNKSIQRAKDLASITTEDPQNKQTVYKAACLVWELAQEYRSGSSNYYVSRKCYEASVKRVDLLAAEITEGSYKELAVAAVSEVREYLSLVAEYRIRENRKCRVF